MQPKAHVMVATPTYTGEVVSDYALSLALASSHCMTRNILIDPRFAPGFSLVEYARNWLTAEFLSYKKPTHLFWIDSDLYFQPNRIADFVNLNVDVVAGVYTTKHETAPTYPYTALGPVVNGLQEADKVPGGFMCMKRHVVEKLVESCEWHEIEMNGETRMSPRMFDLRLVGKRLYGEDFIACARIRHAGFKVLVYPDVQFKHWGRRAWPAHLSSQLEIEDKNGFVGQNTPEAWKKNEAESLTSVLHEPTDH